MLTLTYLSYFDVLCLVFREEICKASFFTDQPLKAAVNSTQNTHNNYDYHTTIIGFVAAPKAPPV